MGNERAFELEEYGAAAGADAWRYGSLTSSARWTLSRKTLSWETQSGSEETLEHDERFHFDPD